jgi:hypothetical protein
MDPFSGTIHDLTDSEVREGAFVNAVGVCAKSSAPAREELVQNVVRSLDREPFPNESDLMMNWDDARSLAKSGHVVGSHTMTHPNVAHISAEDARVAFPAPPSATLRPSLPPTPNHPWRKGFSASAHTRFSGAV